VNLWITAVFDSRTEGARRVFARLQRANQLFQLVPDVSRLATFALRLPPRRLRHNLVPLLDRRPKGVQILIQAAAEEYRKVFIAA